MSNQESRSEYDPNNLPLFKSKTPNSSPAELGQNVQSFNSKHSQSLYGTEEPNSSVRNDKTLGYESQVEAPKDNILSERVEQVVVDV